MFQYARKNINKWLINNDIKLHFIMKHFNINQSIYFNIQKFQK